jgi:hypothetical protein
MGNPISAAAVHLSIKDGYSAVIKLMRANCFYEAFILAKILKIDILINYLNGYFIQKSGKLNIFKQITKDLIKFYPDFQLLANYHLPNKESLDELSKTVI